ncbi:MAG: TrkH family potassium uptake protein [Perlucidibaca sp.]
MRHWLPHLLLISEDSPLVRGMNPASLVAGSFLLLIVLGAALLHADWATTQEISWSDALFTATSAVTVTGLGVVDTGTTFSLAGQVVLMVLMQLGGIGIMTFAALALLIFGQQLGLGDQRLVREAMNHTRVMDLGWLVKRIFALVISIELLGFCLLALIWVPEAGWRHGLFQSAFYAISAFNNAGFALSADSLAGWAGRWDVSLVLGALIIIGGLGFTVLSELRAGRRWSAMSLHSKLMLSGTAGLLALAFIVFALCEWNNPATLAGHDTSGKLAIAFFHAITPRTAGFNMVDIAGMSLAVTMLYIVLMFIGGGTNSTASGIKVTTLMVLLLATRAFLRGRATPSVHGRHIPAELILKALAMVFIATLAIIVALFLLTLTDPGLGFLNLLFETVSAFGTVGLSRGITGSLSEPGRCIIIVVMFIGRIGPLTLVFLLARPRLHRIRHPAGEVHIG